MRRGFVWLNGNNKRSSDGGAETATFCAREKDDDDQEEREIEWEKRPCGMLVQKRNNNNNNSHDQLIVIPNLRIRVEYGALRYQISANSQSTFGDLKKILTLESGMQPAEQRLIFRGKVRENWEYLDRCGVKDRSKVILIEDPQSKERKLIQMRKNAKILAAHRFIDHVSTEIDSLADQVSAIEKSIANGAKVAELQITTLIEMLMRQAVKLDDISAEGDASEKKDVQERRVQKCVEKLDVLKVSNGKGKVPLDVTTKWETFDPSPAATQWEFFD